MEATKKTPLVRLNKIVNRMKPFVVIRKHENQDNVALQRLIREFVMSGAWEAFVSCLFREVRYAHILAYLRSDEMR